MAGWMLQNENDGCEFAAVILQNFGSSVAERGG